MSESPQETELNLTNAEPRKDDCCGGDCCNDSSGSDCCKDDNCCDNSSSRVSCCDDSDTGCCSHGHHGHGKRVVGLVVLVAGVFAVGYLVGSESARAKVLAAAEMAKDRAAAEYPGIAKKVHKKLSHLHH